MVDREIYDAGDGGAAAIVAGLLAVVLVVVGLFFFLPMAASNTAPGIDVTPKQSVGVAPGGQ